MRKAIDPAKRCKPRSFSLSPELESKIDKRANPVGGLSRYIKILIRYDLEKNILPKALVLELKR